MLRSTLTVSRSCISGRGVFARQEIPALEIVWYPCESCLTVPKYSVSRLNGSDINALKEFGLTLSNGCDLLPCRGAAFFNHSCTPNVLQVGQNFGMTVRKVATGEELTIDYATFPHEPPWSFLCRCRENDCRRLIHSQRNPNVRPELTALADNSVQNYIHELMRTHHSEHLRNNTLLGHKGVTSWSTKHIVEVSRTYVSPRWGMKWSTRHNASLAIRRILKNYSSNM
ncbi:SET domain-containing protein [Aliiroseovarius sp. CAU 1755]